MKKNVLLMFPVIIFFGLCMCACGNTSSSVDDGTPPEIVDPKPQAPTKVFEFDCDSAISLYYGTQQDTAIAKIVAVEEGVDVNPRVEWDDTIINYDVDSGLITAEGVGSTTLKLYYEQNEQVIQDEVNVNVIAANFASHISIRPMYFIKLNQPTSSEPVRVSIDKNYNLGLDYFSADESIFTVDGRGAITPVSAGHSTLTVRAKSGVDAEGNYSFIIAVADIYVEEPATYFDLEILDKDYNEAEYVINDDGMKVYTLYSAAENAESNFYFLHFSSDVRICGKIWQSISTSNDVNVINTNRPIWTEKVSSEVSGYRVYNEDYTGFFQPFYVLDAGTATLNYAIFDDGLNYTHTLQCENVIINVYCASEEITSKLYTDGTEGVQDFVAVQDVYTLYALGGSEQDKELALGIYANTAHMVLENTQVYYDGRYRVTSSNPEILQVVQTLEGWDIIAVDTGTAQINIVPMYGAGEKSIAFNVLPVEPESVGFAHFENDTVCIFLDEYIQGSISLEPTSVYPAFATTKYSIKTISDQWKSVQITEGLHVLALSIGTCEVTVVVNDKFQKTYTITVTDVGNSIRILSDATLSVNVGEFALVQYLVTDHTGSGLEDQRVILEIVDDKGNVIRYSDEFISNINIDTGMSNICIQSSVPANISFYLYHENLELRSELIQIEFIKT